MRIAVLSGKGGTGKTFVSVNLSCAAAEAVYVDCDVEEPNGYLFLKPEIMERLPVTVTVPEVEPGKCTSCRKCVDFCKYNALALIRDKLLIFHEVCHSCGGCMLFCPAKAITEKEREIGAIAEGRSGNVTVLTGFLNTGEVSGVPVIKKLMNKLPRNGQIVIDCPPGSACIVMESIREADYCVLVAEPSLFGVHNLSMVYDLVRLFDKPFGVVLNKCLPEENPAEGFCSGHQIRILGRIPYDAELGKLNSQGHIAVRESKPYREFFCALLKRITGEAE
ncbi:MAG: ATP-binding protein [Peptococcaceae bacterium]|nr:ATP-binding protein [Peptococcaceae bacterium]